MYQSFFKHSVFFGWLNSVLLLFFIDLMFLLSKKEDYIFIIDI